MQFDEDLATHYASADLFLFASESETFGNVVVEAMASGLTVLTYDYAAGRQFIRSGENGFLVPKGDAAAFQDSLRMILAKPETWPALQAAARAKTETYPWSRTIERFSRILESAAV
jgi:glycosyltransferase involved in cell wall biosynthesis